MDAVIPIKNLYYLFCYAWDRFEQAKAIALGGEPGPDISNLFAKVIAAGTRQVLRRGLDRGYISHIEDTGRIRGRILFGATVKRDLLRQAKAACEFDELEYDILHNQILRSTIIKLANSPDVDKALRAELRSLNRELEQIAQIEIRNGTFRKVQLSRQNGYYDFLMKLCQLIHNALLPEKSGSRFRFDDILRDEVKMRLVFQSFVKNFYRAEQSAYKVSSKEIAWSAKADVEELKLLPKMVTDVCLESRSRTIIIDTKYTPRFLQANWGKESARSEHLYQLFSYITNWRYQTNAGTEVEGILLYPAMTDETDLRYEMPGCKIRIATVSLADDWQRIHDRLLALAA